MNQPVELALPPHSVEAEQAVLGSLMLNNSAYERVHWIHRDDFYRADHREIYVSILRLIAAGKPADVLTVGEDLKGRDRLAECGGVQYLHGLAQSTPSAANIHRYAEIVKERATQRGLMTVLLEADGIARDHRLPISEKLDQIQGKLLAVSKDNVREPMNTAKLTEQHTELMRRRHVGELVGIPTGLIDLDKKLRGLQRQDLIVIAGRPSMGKSALAFEIGENAAMRGHTVLCLSMEMSTLQCTDRAVARLSGQPLEWVLDGRLYGGQALDDAYNAYGSLPMYVDEQPALTVMQAKTKARSIKRRHGLDLIVIDYLQLMRAKGQDRNMEISSITAGLKQMAKELDVPVVVLSQLNRKCEERQDKRPILSDLRDSGAVEQDADVIIFVYREEFYHPDWHDWHGIAEAIIAKNRQGAPGMVPLTFIGPQVSFRNFAGQMPERHNRKAERVEQDGIAA